MAQWAEGMGKAGRRRAFANPSVPGTFRTKLGNGRASIEDSGCTSLDAPIGHSRVWCFGKPLEYFRNFIQKNSSLFFTLCVVGIPVVANVGGAVIG
jgi:hypothetical protein